MDKFEAMAVFQAAAEAGSLSAGARKLGMPLATVSRKVAELETHLRTTLVTRTSRRLQLTEAGTAYLATCRGILEQIAEAERQAAGEYVSPKGELIITAPVVFGRLHMLPVITEFIRTYPDIDIRLILADRIVNLMEEYIDVALRIGILPDSSLVASRMGLIRRIVCASPAYLEQHGTPLHPRELIDLQCVNFEGMNAPNRWTFGSGKTLMTVPVRSRLTVNTADAALDAAEAGVGLTRVLSYQATRLLKEGKLVRALQPYEPEPLPVSLIHTGMPQLPGKLRAFIDFATPRLRAALAQVSTTVG